LDVSVPGEGVIELSWLFVPGEDAQRPAITMAYGYAGTKCRVKYRRLVRVTPR
jgi:hypothetical protein